jgi:hypothetical protein
MSALFELVNMVDLFSKHLSVTHDLHGNTDNVVNKFADGSKRLNLNAYVLKNWEHVVPKDTRECPWFVSSYFRNKT